MTTASPSQQIAELTKQLITSSLMVSSLSLELNSVYGLLGQAETEVFSLRTQLYQTKTVVFNSISAHAVTQGPIPIKRVRIQPPATPVNILQVRPAPATPVKPVRAASDVFDDEDTPCKVRKTSQ
jgi:hypothetical protein